MSIPQLVALWVALMVLAAVTFAPGDPIIVLHHRVSAEMHPEWSQGAKSRAQ